MLKVKDKLVMKHKVLVDNLIPFEEREFELTYLAEGGFFEAKGTKNGEPFAYGTFSHKDSDLLKDFYIKNNINYELLNLLETLEFKEFNGITVDGKRINISVV